MSKTLELVVHDQEEDASAAVFYDTQKNTKIYSIIFVRVIAWVTVLFGINSMSNGIKIGTRPNRVLFQLLYECY